MSELRLSWMRDEEGVIVIYATDKSGRKVAVADFWTGPMRQHMGIPEPRAKGTQQQLAETLVWNWNGPPGGEADEPVTPEDDDDDLVCVNAHDRCYGGAGGPCPYCERRAAPKPGEDKRLWPNLDAANAIRDAVNEALARYDVPSDVYEQDILIDAACVQLADNLAHPALEAVMPEGEPAAYIIWRPGLGYRVELVGRPGAEMLAGDDGTIAPLYEHPAPEPGELERLRAESERLREGLKPFSEEAAAWVDHMPDGEPLWISLGPGFDPMPSKISINDLRRARAALAEGESHE